MITLCLATEDLNGKKDFADGFKFEVACGSSRAVGAATSGETAMAGGTAVG